ncbi:MAG TPA: type IV pilin protein [Steroidobacteraceae bacterium]|nr:type IV pilin protein [Steroidobacteraceae bacterium]
MKRGFSLLELLVALAIAALLAAIAWPGYGAIIRRAQRNDARLALLAIQHSEELHYQATSTYTDALTLAAADGGLGLAARSSAGDYELAVSLGGDGQHYTASARALPEGRQAADLACATLMLDDIGTRGATDAAGRDATTQCWR